MAEKLPCFWGRWSSKSTLEGLCLFGPEMSREVDLYYTLVELRWSRSKMHCHANCRAALHGTSFCGCSLNFATVGFFHPRCFHQNRQLGHFKPAVNLQQGWSSRWSNFWCNNLFSEHSGPSYGYSCNSHCLTRCLPHGGLLVPPARAG